MSRAVPRVAAVLGVGLMGGSLALALRRNGWRVIGLARRVTTLREARRRKAIDVAIRQPGPVLREASVVVLCAPVDRLLSLARAAQPFLRPDALVMDVGSVKGSIAREAGKIFQVFVGAHPMTGSEKTGVKFARADLYRGAVCALTPTARTPAGRTAEAERFWRAVGAHPVRMDPDVHDRVVALVSHVPHLMADALTLAAGRFGRTKEERSLIKALAAGSFRDATRVAGADPDQWHAIFSMNDRSVRTALAAFQAELSRLARRNWRVDDLARARAVHNQFRKDVP